MFLNFLYIFSFISFIFSILLYFSSFGSTQINNKGIINSNNEFMDPLDQFSFDHIARVTGPLHKVWNDFSTKEEWKDILKMFINPDIDQEEGKYIREKVIKIQLINSPHVPYVDRDSFLSWHTPETLWSEHKAFNPDLYPTDYKESIALRPFNERNYTFLKQWHPSHWYHYIQQLNTNGNIYEDIPAYYTPGLRQLIPVEPIDFAWWDSVFYQGARTWNMTSALEFYGINKTAEQLAWKACKGEVTSFFPDHATIEEVGEILHNGLNICLWNDEDYKGRMYVGELYRPVEVSHYEFFKNISKVCRSWKEPVTIYMQTPEGEIITEQEWIWVTSLETQAWHNWYPIFKEARNLSDEHVYASLIDSIVRIETMCAREHGFAKDWRTRPVDTENIAGNGVIYIDNSKGDDDGDGKGINSFYFSNTDNTDMILEYKYKTKFYTPNFREVLDDALELFDLIDKAFISGYDPLYYFEAIITNNFFTGILLVLVFLHIAYGIKHYFFIIANGYQRSLELFYDFIANMLKTQVGKVADKYMPYIGNTFSFILLANLLGMTLYAFTLTSHIMVTFTIGVGSFIGLTLIGFLIQKFGFFNLFIPTGIPVALLPMLVIIEIISYLSRALSLSIRLFANLMSGHTLLHILGYFSTKIFKFSKYAGLLTFVLILAIVILEGSIAVLQAYVFAILICIYLKDSFYAGH